MHSLFKYRYASISYIWVRVYRLNAEHFIFFMIRWFHFRFLCCSGCPFRFVLVFVLFHLLCAFTFIFYFFLILILLLISYVWGRVSSMTSRNNYSICKMRINKATTTTRKYKTHVQNQEGMKKTEWEKKSLDKKVKKTRYSPSSHRTIACKM